MPPPALAASCVVLSNRTSVSLFEEALLRLRQEDTSNPTVLMPRLYHLGDLGAWADDLAPDLMRQALPPGMCVMTPLQRLGLLTQHLRHVAPALTGHRDVLPDALHALAQDAVTLLDAATIEEVDLDTLEDTIPQTLAHRWDPLKPFWSFLSTTWPQILADHNLIEPYVYQKRAADILCSFWRDVPTNQPIILAGSTGTAPRVRRLMQALLARSLGNVVLPGYRSPPATTTPEGHPLMNMTRLLSFLKKTPQDVQHWPCSTAATATQTRRAAWMLAAFDNAPSLHSDAASLAQQGVTLIEADTPAEEALSIALKIRQTLEETTQNILVITQDAALQSLIASQLKRWHITLAPSSGLPLTETLPGSFMQRLLDLVVLSDNEKTANLNVMLLSLLKHPFCFSFLRSKPWTYDKKERWLRILEAQFLRQKAPLHMDWNAPWTGVPDAHAKALHVRLALQGVSWCLAPLRQMQGQKARLDVWVQCVRDSVARLWGLGSTFTDSTLASFGAHPDHDVERCAHTNRVMSILQDLAQASQAFGMLSLAEASLFMTQHVQRTSVTAMFQMNQRVRMLGTHEGRLASADLIVLAGLSPLPTPPQNPWISHAMQKTLGLSDEGHAQSLASHDFCQAFLSAPDVLLTRHMKTGDTVVSPSPFLLRLKRALGAEAFKRDETTLRWARQLLRHPPADPVRQTRPPRPCPAPSLRPKRLSASALTLLSYNPYAFYAKYILRLHPLPPLGGALSPALFGTTLHAVLERFHEHDCHEAPCSLEGIEQRLLRLAEDAWKPYTSHASVNVFWWAHLKELVSSLAEELAAVPSTAKVYHEIEGQLTCDIQGHRFTLYAKADRVVVTSAGVAISDYKTGVLPTIKEVEGGVAPQIPLEGAIWQANGFFIQKKQPAYRKLPVGELSFWHLGRGGLTVRTLKDPEALSQATLAHLKRVLQSCVAPGFVYGAPPFAYQKAGASDYKHLARPMGW